MKHFRYNRNSSDIQIKFKRPGIETSVSILVPNVPPPASSSPTEFKCAIPTGTTVNRAKRAGKFSVDHSELLGIYSEKWRLSRTTPRSPSSSAVYISKHLERKQLFFCFLVKIFAERAPCETERGYAKWIFHANYFDFFSITNQLNRVSARLTDRGRAAWGYETLPKVTHLI